MMLLLVLLAGTSAACAAFTRAATWKLDSIGQTDAGTWCYQPKTSSPTGTPRGCTNATLTALIDTHINNTFSPGLSIAYYDLADLSTLGGAGWSDWYETKRPVGVCMSGAVAVAVGRVVDANPRYATVCRFAELDDDYDSPSAHEPQCTVALPQKFVSDGCYTLPAPSAPQVVTTPASSTVDRGLAIFGAVAAAIGVWGAGWAMVRYLRKRRMAQVDDDEMALVERRTTREESGRDEAG